MTNLRDEIVFAQREAARLAAEARWHYAQFVKLPRYDDRRRVERQGKHDWALSLQSRSASWYTEARDLMGDLP